MNKAQWQKFLHSQQAQITESAEETLVTQTANPAGTAAENTFLTPLLHQGLLKVEGPDSAKFLQGQLTCDVNAATATRSTLGACCTPQGRMFSSFRLFQASTDNAPVFLLRMRANIVESTRETLHKYSVFFKTQLAATDAWLGLGIWGEKSAAQLSQLTGLDCHALQVDDCQSNEDYIVIRVPGALPRYECWVKGDALPGAWQSLASQSQTASTYDWFRQDIYAGIGEISQATQLGFNPHMLNFQAVGAISFDKGCYTGQEIVARTHYRGHSKRHMHPYRINGEPLLPIGSELQQPETGRTVATVLTAAPHAEISPAQEDALLIVNRELDTTASIELKHGEQAYRLEPLPLPYTLQAPE